MKIEIQNTVIRAAQPLLEGIGRDRSPKDCWPGCGRVASRVMTSDLKVTSVHNAASRGDLETLMELVHSTRFNSGGT